MRAGLIALVVVIGLAVIGALQSFFITTPTQQALVLQFGEVRQAIREPGLNAKIPFIQDVIFLDKRVLELDVPAQEIIAADQKRLVVDAFMRYRIANPVRFYQTVNNVREGQTRLSTFVQSSLRAVLADATFTDIVREERPALMQRIRAQVSERASDVGVDIVDVKIRRADLPAANSEAIFRRMRTEREQEATQIRAEGQEAARRITAAADRAATVLRAEAQRESEQIRGEGDARRSAIFASAYGQDADFFSFFRAMQAYEQALLQGDTRLVLSPSAEFFRYFNDPMGVSAAARATVEEETGVRLPAPAAPSDEEEDAPAEPGADVSVIEDGEVRPEAVAADADEAIASDEDSAADLPRVDRDMSTQEILGAIGQSSEAVDAAVDRATAVMEEELRDAGVETPVGGDADAAAEGEGDAAADGEGEAAADGEGEAATEGDVEAELIEEGVPAEEASTAGAIETADPETSEAADRAAEGEAGEESSATTVVPTESGTVTIVRPETGTATE